MFVLKGGKKLSIIFHDIFLDLCFAFRLSNTFHFLLWFATNTFIKNLQNKTINKKCL